MWYFFIEVKVPRISAVFNSKSTNQGKPKINSGKS